MSYTVKFPIALISIFIWIGFVGAISFMEAWLKFRAPGITIPLGLGIGRLVFGALNKVEIVLFIIIMIGLLSKGASLWNWAYLPLLIPFVLLALQTFWLLPALDIRAEAFIQGEVLPASNLHYFYIGFEFIKLISLSYLGLTLFTK